jgi:hypothetical protein
MHLKYSIYIHVTVKTEHKLTSDVPQNEKLPTLQETSINKQKLKNIQQDEATESPIDKLKRLENGKIIF